MNWKRYIRSAPSVGSTDRWPRSRYIDLSNLAHLVPLLLFIFVIGIFLAIRQVTKLSNLEKTIEKSLAVERLFDSLRAELQLAREAKAAVQLSGKMADRLTFIGAQERARQLLEKITAHFLAIKGDSDVIRRLNILVNDELARLHNAPENRTTARIQAGVYPSLDPESSLCIKEIGVVLSGLEKTLENNLLHEAGVSNFTERATYIYIAFWILLLTVLSGLLYARVKKELRKRRQAEEKYRSIFQNSTEGQFLMDSRGKLTEANGALARLYGYESPQAFMQATRGEARFLFPNAELYEFFREKMQNERIARGLEFEITNARGNEVKVFLSARAVSDGNSECIQGQIVDFTWRHHTEKNLRVFSKAIEQSSELVIIVDSNEHIQFVNAAFEKITGYSKNELLRKRFDEFDLYRAMELYGKQESVPGTAGFLEADSGFWEKIWPEAQAGNPVRAVFRSRKKNGEEFYQDTFITPIRNSDGRISHYIITGRDITREWEMAESLSRSEEKFRTIFELAQDAMLLYSVDEKRIVEANCAAERISGFSREEICQRPIESFLASTDLDSLKKNWRRQVEQNGYFRLELTANRKEGQRIEFEVNGAPVQIEEKQFLLIVARDQTEAKRAERENRQLTERYRRLFHEDLTGDCIMDSDGNILLANRAFRSMFGIEEEDNRPINIRQFFPEKRSWEDLFERLYESKRLSEFEIEMVRKDGSPIYLIANLVLQFNTDTGQTEVIAYFYDLTERKRLAEQLLQSQKLEAIGRLVGGIAHDFNNLLTIILGYGTFLLDRLRPDSEEYQDVAEIRKAGEKAAALTSQLLAFSRKQVLQTRPVNLNETVRNMQKMLQRLLGDDVELKTILEENVPFILADPVHLDQIMVNLAVNARDAMPKGGSLVFATQTVYLDEHSSPRLHNLPPGKYVMLGVSDTGVGMDPETKKKIFDPFFTTKEAGKGTGLGLSTVYGIVAQMGGAITVDSEPGKGTIFRVFFPELDERALHAHSRSSGMEAWADTKGTILLVEDDFGLRKLIVRILAEKGFQVLAAGNASEALELAEHCDRIHLLLTDVVLPGLNGRELADRLLEEFPEMKVLYISGYTDDMILRYGIETDRFEFLEKPFTKDDLLHRIGVALNGKRAAAAAQPTP